MAAPEEFVEITDFRPGIWSDMYAASRSGDFALPSASTIKANMPGNGAATIENTFNCKSDKGGSLVPLPERIVSDITPVTGHIPADQYTTAHRPAAFPAAYLLDAEVSPPSWYFNITTGNPLPGVNLNAMSIYTLWGFFHAQDGLGVSDGYFLYVLGREYRPYAPFEPVYDYLFTRSIGGGAPERFGPGVNGREFMNFPTGSLTTSRLDNGSDPDVIAAFGVLFSVESTTPVIVGLVSYGFNGNPSGTQMQQGAIPAGEQAWLTAYHATPGSGVTVKRPSTYSPPTILFSSMAGRDGHTVIGMSLGTDGYDVGAAHPVDEWSWHENDAAVDTNLRNAPYTPYMLIAHQGRIVMPDSTGYKGYFASRENDPTPAAVDGWSMFFSDDILWYSGWAQPIGDVYTPVATERMRSYTPLQVAEDQVSKIGVLGVVTGDELLVVKARGGGVTVRGDLDNPTIRRLPHIESTHGITSKGAQTPIGYVYGTRTGVFVFDGGDATRKLSRQIDGFFWNPYAEEDIVLEGSYGRFAYWNDMVFAPNNYVYDVETDSWWRLDDRLIIDLDPLTYMAWPHYNIYVPDNVGNLLCFPYKVTEATADNSGRVCHQLDSGFLATTYSWQSHPLVETRGRRVSFQDVRILATSRSAATITVTLTGFDEEGATIASPSVVLTCAANDDRPQLLREDIAPNFVAEYVSLRVQTDAGNLDDPAPKIHSIRLGIRPRQTTPRHG